MEYRFKDAPPEPQEGGRLKFVLKRPDGAKRVAPSAPIPVKYALEDEIVDEGLQRGGLRKTKSKRPSRFHSLYDFGNEVDPFLLSASHPGVETRLQAYSNPTRSPHKPKAPSRHHPLTLTTSDPPVRPKSVSFKDDIVPASSHAFPLKRKHRDSDAQRSTQAPSSKASLALTTRTQPPPPTTATQVTPALVQSAPPVPPRSPPRLLVAATPQLAPAAAQAPPSARRDAEEYFFVPATEPEASEPAPRASDEAPSQ